MSDLAALAQTLLKLHQPGNPVVLPTAWDVWSARTAADSGFLGLTVGSHPVADSIGAGDNEGLQFEQVTARVKAITQAIDVPVSVDLESGYGLAPGALVAGLLDAGAVGLNIEDTVHSENGRLRSAEEHAEYVAGLRRAADAAGVHVVINARTDLFVREDGDESDRVERAIARLKLAAEAGADVLYPVFDHDDTTYKKLAEALPLPINAIAEPFTESLSRFAPLGVGRISFGPRWQSALAKASVEKFTNWK